MGNYVPLGDEEDSLELKLTFNGEVLNSQVVLPVIGQALIEGRVLLGLDVVGVAGPDRLRLVQLFVLDLFLLDLFLLLVLRFFGFVFILDFLDLRVFLIFLVFLLLLLLLLVVVNLLKKGELVDACDCYIIYREEQRTASTSLVTTSWMG